MENGGEFIEWSWRNKPADAPAKTESFDVTVTVLIVLTLLVAYYGVRWYRRKPKKRKLCRRLLSLVQCKKLSV